MGCIGATGTGLARGVVGFGSYLSNTSSTASSASVQNRIASLMSFASGASSTNDVEWPRVVERLSYTPYYCTWSTPHSAFWCAFDLFGVALDRIGCAFGRK